MKQEGNASAGLFRIYYHVLKHRSDHGFGRWAARARDAETRLGSRPLERRVLSAAEPIEAAVEPLAEASDRLRLHATAALLLGIWLTRERREARKEFEIALLRLRYELGDSEWKRLAAARDADDALRSAYSMVLRCEFDFRILVAELDALNVTKFEARVTRASRSGESIAAFGAAADPQEWQVQRPDTFAQSFRTNQAAPQDPFADPTPASSPAGQSWKGHLFEEAEFALVPGFDVTRLRNTLNIDFVVDPAASQISLAYSLFESLSNSVFGASPEQGGLDVDSGRGRVELIPGTLLLQAGKSIRFAPAALLHDELNITSLPFLVCWLSVWLVDSVCR